MKLVIHHIKNEKGQAFIECAAMMVMLFSIIVFLVIIYDFMNQAILQHQAIRHEFRISADKNAEGRFRQIVKKTFIHAEIPGTMKQILGKPFYRETLTLKGYEGCYQGLGKSKYAMKYLYRSVFP